MFAFIQIGAVSAALKRRRKKPEPRPDELFAGVPKPSTVLVELVCADWIKNGVHMKRKVEHPHYDTVRETSTVKTDWYWIEITRSVYRGRSEDVRWRMVSPNVSLSDHETALLKAAKTKAEQLAADRAVAECEAKGQEAALQAIEKYLNINQKEEKI